MNCRKVRRKIVNEIYIIYNINKVGGKYEYGVVANWMCNIYILSTIIKLDTKLIKKYRGKEKTLKTVVKICGQGQNHAYHLEGTRRERT